MILTLGVLIVLAAFRLRPENPKQSSWQMTPIALFFASSIIYYLSQSLSQIAYIITGVTSFVVLVLELQRPNRNPRPFAYLPAWAAIFLTFWLLLRDILGPGTTKSATAQFFVTGLILLSLVSAIISNSYSIARMVKLSSWFVGAALIIGTFRGNEWSKCNALTGKCTFAGRIYVGIFNSENAIAIFVMLTLVLALQLKKSWPKRFIIVICCIILAITGSRSPLYAFAIGTMFSIAVYFTCVPIHVGSIRGYRASRPLGIGAFILSAAGSLEIVTHSRSGAFSGRQEVWALVLQFVRPTSLVGMSEKEYSNLAKLGYFHGIYPNDEYLALIFFGGLVAVILYGVFIESIWFIAKRENRFDLVKDLFPIAMILGYNVTEMSWNAGALNPTLWIVIVLMAGGVDGVTQIQAARQEILEAG